MKLLGLTDAPERFPDDMIDLQWANANVSMRILRLRSM